MDLRQIEYFLAITDCGAFSRAAGKLSVSQPILSRQIKTLEDTLGAKLYHRTGRGVALTEAGKLLEKYARVMLEARSAAQFEIASVGLSPTGHVRIGMPPSVAAAMTGTIVQRFSQKFPKVLLGVMEGFGAHVLDWLVSGRIDVAILQDTPHSRALSTDELFTDELFLLGPIDNPFGVGDGVVPMAALKDIPLILPSRPHGLRLLVDTFLARFGGHVANVCAEIDAVPTTLGLVEAKVAYTVIPYACVHHLVETKRVRYWRLEPTIRRKFVLASSTLLPSTEASRALAEIVRAQARVMVRSGKWSPST
jgi:LysR family nitrogen assimilation transcriptional regulator